MDPTSERFRIPRQRHRTIWRHRLPLTRNVISTDVSAEVASVNRSISLITYDTVHRWVNDLESHLWVLILSQTILGAIDYFRTYTAWPVRP
jgi:hypothetical protein